MSGKNNKKEITPAPVADNTALGIGVLALGVSAAAYANSGKKGDTGDVSGNIPGNATIGGNITVTGMTNCNGGVTTSGVHDVNATTLDVDSAGAVTIDAGAASNFTTSAGALTLSGVGVNIVGGNAKVDITTTGALDINAGALTLSGVGVNIVGGNAEVDITTTGALDINAGATTIDSSANIEIKQENNAANHLKLGSANGKLGFLGDTGAVKATTVGTGLANFVENLGGTAVNLDSTFGGYKLQQVVKALVDYGLL